VTVCIFFEHKICPNSFLGRSNSVVLHWNARQSFLFHRRIFINVLQYFHLFCDCSVLTTSFVWLRHLCKVQIPKGAATYFSPLSTDNPKSIGQQTRQLTVTSYVQWKSHLVIRVITMLQFSEAQCSQASI